MAKLELMGFSKATFPLSGTVWVGTVHYFDKLHIISIQRRHHTVLTQPLSSQQSQPKSLWMAKILDDIFIVDKFKVIFIYFFTCLVWQLSSI